MLTVEEIASRLGVSSNTVCNLIKRKELAAIQVGRQFRIEPADFERFLAANKTGQGAA